jgi:phosphoribosylformimino-5-aminoimidazole carboxamide ribotide isomerase
VIGTAALRDPSFVGRLVTEHGPDRIAVALDVRDGLAVGHGWAAGAAGVAPDDALSELSARGVTTFEVTAIDRDGTLAGPDLALYDRLVALGLGSVIASGGVATTDDVEAVRRIGCAGVIVGRALYDGRIRIDELAW